jgi:hypothetical protein
MDVHFVLCAQTVNFYAARYSLLVPFVWKETLESLQEA